MDSNKELINEYAKTTKETGEQIGEFLQSVFKRLSLDSTKEQLERFNIEYEHKETIEVYTEVAKRFKALDKDNQKSLLQALGGTYHFTRMKVFLDVLDKE